jgi:hypothetical protein
MLKNNRTLSIMILTAMLAATSPLAAQTQGNRSEIDVASQVGNDGGYIIAGPRIPGEHRKTLEDGLAIDEFTQRGVVLSDNPASPWHHASIFVDGTTYTNAEGEIVKEIVLFETTDPNGDVTWSCILRDTKDGAGEFFFVAGTGKWQWIAGQGEILRLKDRADDHIMPEYEINWKLDPKRKHLEAVRTAGYDNYATGFTFHGPHVARATRKFSNGTAVIWNHQAGVIVGNDPDSPIYRSTFFVNGSRIAVGEDLVLTADLGRAEWIDSDGDMFWVIGIDFYPGPIVEEGVCPILGGTGKYEGMTGYVRFTGGAAGGPRTDDYHLVNWEIAWNMP